jgi:hypothetical protein
MGFIGSAKVKSKNGEIQKFSNLDAEKIEEVGLDDFIDATREEIENVVTDIGDFVKNNQKETIGTVALTILFGAGSYVLGKLIRDCVREHQQLVQNAAIFNQMLAQVQAVPVEAG